MQRKYVNACNNPNPLDTTSVRAANTAITAFVPGFNAERNATKKAQMLRALLLTNCVGACGACCSCHAATPHLAGKGALPLRELALLGQGG